MIGGMAKDRSGIEKQISSNHSIDGLRAMAVRGLARMYCPQERLYFFRLKKDGDSIIAEGLSRRYTAISLIGLATLNEAEAAKATGGHALADICARLESDVAGMDSIGDVALSVWAACAIGYGRRENFWQRIMELDPLGRSHPVVELSWVLDAACKDAGTAAADGIRDRLAQRLMKSLSPKSGVFPHVLGGSGSRTHVSCFADMVYPIHALANYSRHCGNRDALEAANLCAERICSAQGSAGQWWWHYDVRTGKVVEGYPVYAIHQDAMGPMALLALREAGGKDFAPALQKGLDWLWHAPEIGASLVDDAADLVWRKVARREPNKLSRYLQAGATLLHPALRVPGTDMIFPPVQIDYEDRPYHLGWLLHAWTPVRTRNWSGIGAGR